MIIFQIKTVKIVANQMPEVIVIGKPFAIITVSGTDVPKGVFEISGEIEEIALGLIRFFVPGDFCTN